MSGFEIAGVVLGAFPIVMSGLERYRKAFEPLKSWWKFQRTFEDFIDDVGTQRALFDNNLEKLLCPFVDSDTHMGILLENPSGAAWSDKKLEEKLNIRLGSTYPFYKSIVRRMVNSLEELQALLGFKKGQTTALWERNLSRWELELEFKRIRISFSRNKFDQVNTLAKRNDDLSTLLNTNDELAPLRKRRQTAPNASILGKIREHACGLHNALEDAWQCNCEFPHSTNIHLERRVRESSVVEDPWRLLFSSVDLSDRVNMQEVEVRMLEDSENARTESEYHPTTQNPFNQFKADIELKVTQITKTRIIGEGAVLSATTVVSGSKNKPSHTRKRVGFAQLQPTKGEMAATMNPESIQHSQHIEDLCSTLKGVDETNASFGFLKDRSNRKHALRSLSRHPSATAQQRNTTLQSILTQSKPMTRQERFTLALTLASSLLQLQNTPWLYDHWNKNDILFNSENTSYPLLSAEFISKLKPKALRSPTKKFNPKTALSNLGIMLLELCFGKPIEDHPLRPQYFGPNNKPNAFTDISTAKLWHEEVLGELGDEISETIRRCLDCAFAPKPNLGDAEFQEAVFNGVVLPLQDFLKIWEKSV